MKPKNSSSQRRLINPAWVCGGLSAAIGLPILWLLFRDPGIGVSFYRGSGIPWLFLSGLAWFLISTVGIVLAIIVLVQECWDDHCRSAVLKTALLALALNVVMHPFLILRILL